MIETILGHVISLAIALPIIGVAFLAGVGAETLTDSELVGIVVPPLILLATAAGIFLSLYFGGVS